MQEEKIDEREALDLIARIFEQNRRRMNVMRGEVFILWGALFALSAVAEYFLLRWTGDVRVLWSWLIPGVCGWIYTAYNTRRLSLVRTGFDDLLLIVWGFPTMLSAGMIVYAVSTPGNAINPVGIIQLLLSTALAITAEFFRGKGSNQSGSFALLYMAAFMGITTAFSITFREPFDMASGEWLLMLAFYAVLLVLLPGFVLRHITRKQCSKS